MTTTSTLKRPTNGLLDEINATEGPANRSRKLNPARVIRIRLMYAAGFTKAEIARAKGINCTPENVRLVVTRKIWKHI